MPDTDLDELCDAHGIATRYQDFWGREHVPSDATKRLLLSAMGVPDASAPHRQPTHDKPLAVRILRAGTSSAEFDISIPQSLASGALHWQLILESGVHYAGDCAAGPAQTRLACIGMPVALPLGYHRLTVTGAARDDAIVATVAIIVCPALCAGLGDATGSPRWFGPAIQLYALRSRRNWGIGDFTDLAEVARLAAQHGASFVGVNPLHAMLPDRPTQASPYSPSSRLALNPLYLDVEATEDFAESAPAREYVASTQFRARLAALRDAELVDYAGVAAAKVEVFKILYEHFRREHLQPMSVRGRAFRAFAAAARSYIIDAALFGALQTELARGNADVWGWPAWPPEYRDRASQAVREFARAHADDVDFHLYLQWQADRQLARAAKAAHDAGMPIGLYRDLAVGAAPGGAETWRDPQLFAMTVHVGAPPDEFNRQGQDWGLPPWIPHRLSATAFEPWIALLRANMRHAGGLRIDHVMGLMRLFWIPDGLAPEDGTYARYPLHDLLGILALESVRNACAVVGEDLGTVPDAVRRALHDAGVYSYRVLYFERGPGGEFLPPAAYPAQALVTVSTHDLPTLQGFWTAADLAARDALELFPSAELRDRQYADRNADRAHLARALTRENLLARAIADHALSFDDALAVHAYVARTPCALMTVQLEDVFGQAEQINLPATMDAQYPNWRRKIPVDLEEWDVDGRFSAVCTAIRAEGRGVARHRDGAGARSGGGNDMTRP